MGRPFDTESVRLVRGGQRLFLGEGAPSAHGPPCCGALVLCLSAKFVYLGRMLSMNGPLALFTTGTLACAHVAMLPDLATHRRRWLWLLAAPPPDWA